jgi:ABC-type multidrug transport system fused ATPase/permease subunit
VRLRNVSFTYPATSSLPIFLRFNKLGPGDVRSQVLDGVTLDVEPGQMVALVGQSGAGKSTIARLIAGLYPPTRGEVTIGRHPESGSDGRATAVALVPDRPWLIDASIVDNVRYGSPTAALDEVHAACRQASVLGFTDGLPAGLNTRVGVNGSKLSAGERQRVALARALLRRPSILVLDEATALLDADSEAAIREAITQELAGMTRIVIAHRLSTVQDADRIFVVAAGRIVQHGTHEELGKESELYARWVRLQAV